MLFFSSATEKWKRDSDDSDESQPGPSTPKKNIKTKGVLWWLAGEIQLVVFRKWQNEMSSVRKHSTE